MADDTGASQEDGQQQQQNGEQQQQSGKEGDRTPETLEAELREARREAAKYRTSLRAAEKERDDLRTAGQTETEKAIAAAKAEGAQAERDRTNRLLLRAEVRAAAAGKLADPEDALGMLDLSEFTVNDDGTVDTKALAKAIDDLVKAKPYLAGQPQPGGSWDGGTRGGASGSSSDMNALIRQAAGRG